MVKQFNFTLSVPNFLSAQPNKASLHLISNLILVCPNLTLTFEIGVKSLDCNRGILLFMRPSFILKFYLFFNVLFVYNIFYESLAGGEDELMLKQ